MPKPQSDLVSYPHAKPLDQGVRIVSRKPSLRDQKMVTVLVALWFVVAIAAVLWGVPHIERSLTTEVEDALGDAPVDVRLSGRDATLIASGAPEAAEAARLTVASVKGVRQASVDVVASALDEVTVNPSLEPRIVEPVLDDPSVTVRSDRGAFTLSGSVANDETAQTLISAAIAAYGEDRVTADMTIDADTHTPAWLDNPFALLSIVGRHDLGIEVYDKTMRLTGVVPDDATHTDVVRSLEAELDGALTVVDRLVVVPVEEPVFSMEANGGSVTLRGTLPSQGEVNSIRAAAESIYGADSVATWLTVDAASPAIPYLTDADGFFRAFEGRTLNFVDLGDITALRGSVPSDEIRTSIANAVSAILEPRSLSNELEVVEVSEETTAALEAINDIIGASLNFGSGSTSLSDDDRAKLDSVAIILNDNPSLRAVVEGHTDSRGAGNQRLSEERARAVVAYLVEIGIDPDRLSAIGFGESRPIASNETASGRSQNRRIEFNIEGSS